MNPEDVGTHVFRVWTLIRKEKSLKGSFRLVADVDTLPELKLATDQHRSDDYAFVLCWRTGIPRFVWGTFSGQVHAGDTRKLILNLMRRKR